MAGNERSGGGDASIRFLTAQEAAEERRLAAEEAAPAVRKGCICSNGHEPVDGFISSAPCCAEHGLWSRYVAIKGLDSANTLRTPGQIHNARNTRSCEYDYLNRDMVDEDECEGTEADGCLHGVPWCEECPFCNEDEDEGDFA